MRLVRAIGTVLVASKGGRKKKHIKQGSPELLVDCSTHILRKKIVDVFNETST